MAAFNPRAESENARRVVYHPQVGDRVRRGDRYGLIRFGSRTDVLSPMTTAATLETAADARIRATQITGPIARSIVVQLEKTEG